MKLKRRQFLSTLPAALTAAAVGARRVGAQDRDFLRALDEAQRHRPDTLAVRARIAPETEQGTPLNIRGQVVDANGRPVQGAIVFAYHTDRGGLYDEPARGAHSWRLRGWARTDAEGRFEFATIRPGSYPGRQVPAHVHFNIYVGDVRYGAGELRFDDDPLVGDDERERSGRLGPFGQVRPVSMRDGTQFVDFSVRLDESRRF